jgi:hypothetical protein
VGPRAGSDGCGKSPPPPPGFDSRTIQPLASRYTDCAIQAHLTLTILHVRHVKYVLSFCNSLELYPQCYGIAFRLECVLWL